ncbi:deoxyribose-phosphate aldolase [Desulforamulus hydrothermalis]|uniref:Deoxyribose-phosphate aldolase n=1 Tax=Desulforamulus hydrothermalis Lam5 = DSM 18033 TaxID=1121428 RepID=K8DZA6_9FIRM|nr:deoxyribose-phosphate aldolase [Desulforamulus hydrothermalis]CCO08372.1 Deoxyribose-phosphate aldolase [Desulforamulus hydrothermalis Lam5 = DSM 18033]SHH14103.1 deoxyribose-phosphate aldolase [Desulforamulus hydrothermalis Lam5 = DSM 18033]
MEYRLHRCIDHTLLRADATPAEIIKLCQEARQYNFAAVCVNPWHVRLVADRLQGSGVAVCTVIGFPLGAAEPQVKAFATARARQQGAAEFDMVINLGALKAGDYHYVERDIAGVVQAAEGQTVKVILETCYLTEQEKVAACRLAQRAGAHFVKTSTGFGSGGATLQDVALLRQTVGTQMGVKASGGIKTARQAIQMLQAGANRIGTSSGVKIIEEWEKNGPELI